MDKKNNKFKVGQIVRIARVLDAINIAVYLNKTCTIERVLNGPSSKDGYDYAVRFKAPDDYREFGVLETELEPLETLNDRLGRLKGA